MAIKILTASGKEKALVEFYRQLAKDGHNGYWRAATVSVLAVQAKVGRAHLAQVLTGARPGKNTWQRILPLLSERSLFLLRQCSAWNEHAEMALFRFNHEKSKT
jgi:hypothetical protein